MGERTVAPADVRHPPGADAPRLFRPGAARASRHAEKPVDAQPPARDQRRKPRALVAKPSRLVGAGGGLSVGSAILSVATAVPEQRLEAAEALAHLREFWPRLAKLAEADAAIGVRYVCEPVEDLLRPRRLDVLRD